MKSGKSVLVIGLDPTLIDFSQPGYAPGMNATKVLAGLKSSEDELTSLGYSVQTCLTDFGKTAEEVVQSRLKQKQFSAEGWPHRPHHAVAAWAPWAIEQKVLHYLKD